LGGGGKAVEILRRGREKNFVMQEGETLCPQIGTRFFRKKKKRKAKAALTAYLTRKAADDGGGVSSRLGKKKGRVPGKGKGGPEGKFWKKFHVTGGGKRGEKRNGWPRGRFAGCREKRVRIPIGRVGGGGGKGRSRRVGEGSNS